MYIDKISFVICFFQIKYTIISSKVYIKDCGSKYTQFLVWNKNI